MQPEDPQIQQEQLQSTATPAKENRPIEFAGEDDPEFNGCCEACLYYTIKCCDFFSLA